MGKSSTLQDQNGKFSISKGVKAHALKATAYPSLLSDEQNAFSANFGAQVISLSIGSSISKQLIKTPNKRWKGFFALVKPKLKYFCLLFFYLGGTFSTNNSFRTFKFKIWGKYHIPYINTNIWANNPVCKRNCAFKIYQIKSKSENVSLMLSKAMVVLLHVFLRHREKLKFNLNGQKTENLLAATANPPPQLHCPKKKHDRSEDASRRYLQNLISVS